MTNAKFQWQKELAPFYIKALHVLIAIAIGHAEKPTWVNGWRVLLEHLSVVMGKYTAYHGTDHDYFNKRWDADKELLLKDAIACLIDSQQEQFDYFTKAN